MVHLRISNVQALGCPGIRRIGPMYSKTRQACRPSTAIKPQAQASKHVDPSPEDPEAVTKKFGLEAGLFKSLQQKGTGTSAKELLQRYGGAYLVTSITLAVISFTLCYIAVDIGVDISVLLSKLGMTVATDSAVEKGSKFALAYAAHKALSPIRFPPTVALTPIVAQKLGKKDETSSDD